MTNPTPTNLPAEIVDELDEIFEERPRIYVLGVSLETISLVVVGLLIVAFAAIILVAGLDIRDLESLGYLGVFAITFIGAASIVLPTPGLAATAGGGALLDPVFGIPAWVMVGLIAGLAEALGEFTGYALGFGGTPAFQKRRLYQVFYGWMQRYGMLAMFGLSVIPNLLFDVAGVAAGAVRMSPVKFFVSVLAGKTIKSTYIAGAGSLLWDLFG